ncbi:redoxin family protein [Hallella bergensis DSM 17361]|uniref:Redoxin family protein n=1 Tax=Hallella bergensis DSM 17361 TaxID=585502 RepID=D1PVU8_9BACT|nr:TlpA disulfide reductase family protein [Hallella bergensis]EFA44453.1 redoxin family protein [Hallella bergensis DSM 17361]
MKRIILSLAAAVITVASAAQTIHIQGTYDPSVIEGLKLLISPMSGQEDAPTELTLADGTFGGDVPLASDGLYNLLGVNSQMQLHLPFYISSDTQKKKLKVTFVGQCPQINIDSNNKALSAYNLVVWNKLRDIWMNAQKMSNEELKNSLAGFWSAADSVLAVYKTDTDVQEYIRLWATMAAFNGYSASSHLLRDRTNSKPTPFVQLCKINLGTLDTDKVFYFPESYRCIRSTIASHAPLNELLEELQEKYNNPKVIRNIGNFILDNFIRLYDYNADYNKGLNLIKNAVSQYGLSEEYIKAFESHQATIGGKPFPTGINIIDANGNAVDFSSLKGYYVYIDLWASWCAPCRKEIPHLQRLEKELKNPLVKFVSISIDRTEAPWRKAMQEMNCEGNQWINADGSLPNVLNIQGIPHFLIYDKNGKLLKYDAPRPSDPKLKAELEALR